MAADLRVFILGNPSEVGPGGTLTYNLFVRNFGDTIATDIQVVNSLPPGFNVTRTTPGGDFDVSGGESPEDVVTFSGGTLAPGRSAILTIVGTAPLDAMGSIQNVAIVDPPIPGQLRGAVNEGSGANEINNTATLSTNINTDLGPDLRIFKLDSPDPVAPGDPITYTLLVRNDGQATATDIEVRDSLPDGFTVSNVITGGDFGTTGTADANNTITFTGGTLASGESAILTIVGTTSLTAGNTEVENIAVVDPDNDITENDQDDINEDNIVTSTTTLDTDLLPDLVVTKLSNPTTVAPGGTLTYTIRVRNNGPKDIIDTPIVVRDTLDPNFSVFVGTDGVIPGGNFQETSRENNIITFTANGLASGESAILTLVGTVPNVEEGILVNTVVVDPSDINNVEEGGPEDNNTFTNNTTISVSEGPDLGILKLDNPTTVRPGETLTYTLLVRNDGPGGASGIEVRDELPLDFNFISATPGGNFLDGVFTDNPAGTKDVVTFTGGSLASGDSAILTIVGTVSADVSGDLTNTAIVDPNLQIFETGQGDNNNTEVITTTVGLPDLTIFKSGSPSGTLQAGDTLTYTIRVRNDGDAATPLNSIVVQDALPPNFIYIDAVPGGDFDLVEPSEGNNTVTFTGGTLDTGESAILTIVGLVNAAGATAEVTGTAVVDPGNEIAERNTDGTAETNNSDSFTVNVEPPAPVFVHDDWTDALYDPGDSVGVDVDNDGREEIFRINAFPTIGEGIQAVKTDNVDPGVVQVLPGTYGEIVGIGKPVTLIGPQVGVAGDDSSRVGGTSENEAIITGDSAGIGFSAGADAGQVIIDGFRLQGLGTGPGEGATIDTRTAGNDTIIRNNVITNINNDAIRNYPEGNPLLPKTSNLVIQDNLIENISDTGVNPGSHRAMFLQDVENVTISGNVVRDIAATGDNPGILLDTVTGEVLIDGNFLQNIASQGIQVAGIGAIDPNAPNTPATGTANVTISNNILRNVNTRGDVLGEARNAGIRLRNAVPFGFFAATGALLENGTVNVTGNTIEDTTNGILIRSEDAGQTMNLSGVTVSDNFFINMPNEARLIINESSGSLQAPGVNGGPDNVILSDMGGSIPLVAGNVEIVPNLQGVSGTIEL